MPFFTLTADVQQGPVINVFVAVSQPRLEALRQASLPVAPTQPIRALIDTGASLTCIDPSVLQALKLSPTGVATMHTPSTGLVAHQTELYDIGLFIPSTGPQHTPLYRRNMPVLSCELAAFGFLALIGRDVLAECVLVYEGGSGLFTLAF